MPVRVIITFLRTFVSPTLTIGILPGVLGESLVIIQVLKYKWHMYVKIGIHMWDERVYQCKTSVGHFAMPETDGNWIGMVNICVYYASHTCEIYQVLSCSVDFKAPRELWNPLSKTVLTVKLESIMYVGPVTIFPSFWHWCSVQYIVYNTPAVMLGNGVLNISARWKLQPNL